MTPLAPSRTPAASASMPTLMPCSTGGSSSDNERRQEPCEAARRIGGCAPGGPPMCLRAHPVDRLDLCLLRHLLLVVVGLVVHERVGHHPHVACEHRRDTGNATANATCEPLGAACDAGRECLGRLDETLARLVEEGLDPARDVVEEGEWVADQVEPADELVNTLQHLHRVVPHDAIDERAHRLEGCLVEQERRELQVGIGERDEALGHAGELLGRVVLLQRGVRAERLHLHGALDANRVELALLEVELERHLALDVLHRHDCDCAHDADRLLTERLGRLAGELPALEPCRIERRGEAQQPRRQVLLELQLQRAQHHAGVVEIEERGGAVAQVARER
mmetsp:Transcript_8301/g.19907  ORF Transcript_8301/g.19907 Transcript_8301/m.19907 type:complete len:337 (-) Transcript_8301:100-1110(-)